MTRRTRATSAEKRQPPGLRRSQPRRILASPAASRRRGRKIAVVYEPVVPELRLDRGRGASLRRTATSRSYARQRCGWIQWWEACWEWPSRSGGAASKTLNGPSGLTLDSMFLEPLGITRRDAWLCDLLPESRCNPKQQAAIEREYDPRRETLGLPDYNFPPVPSILASATRQLEIEGEILAASPEVLITLGDQPLKWFAQHYGSHPALGLYGETPETYGRFRRW